VTEAAGTAPVICLASASPRRRELLHQLGIAHCVAPGNVDESELPGEAPRDYVLRLARAKAEAMASDPAALGLPVLGADTAVIVDGIILAKPVDAADARRMLSLLAGREHEVLSAVALAYRGRCEALSSVSRVRFASLSGADVDRYVASGEPFGKAGGYAIQGLAAAFIEHLAGSYSGVMGLPLYETSLLLARAGITRESARQM
jgi:septum formation protein